MQYELLKTEEERQQFKKSETVWLAKYIDPSVNAPELQGEPMYWDIEERSISQIRFIPRYGYIIDDDSVKNRALFDNECEARLYVCEEEISENKKQISQLEEELVYLEKERKELLEELGRADKDDEK